MRKFLALTVVVVAAAALAAGTALAGERKKSPPVSLEGEVTNKGVKSVKKGKITINENEFFFKSTFVKAKPGSTVTVRLRNKGDVPHTFTIPSLRIDEELDGGKSAKVEVTLPTDGALPFYCRFHGAPPTGGQGMQGAFFSKKGEAVSTGTGAGGAPDTSAPTTTRDTAPATTAPAGGGYGY